MQLPTPDGGKATVASEMDLEVGRPPGVEPGSHLPHSWAVNVQPLPLPPGRYEWRLEYDKESQAAGFAVRAPA